jgi:uncharacterized protein (TIGR03437 family)
MVTVVVKQGNQQSAPQQVPVAAASPGIFSFAGNGMGPAIVQNFKLSATDDIIAGSFAQPTGFNPNVTGQPAAVGGVVIIYANGFGALANPSQVVTGGVPGVAAPAWIRLIMNMPARRAS